jgi:CheY-like chemotaxis protein
MITIVCEDDGPGIAPELLPTIFEPFAQGPRAIDRQQGGLGLGLSLARSLTELHGGALTYESVSPHGSRFIMRLPAASTNVPFEDANDDHVPVAVTPRHVMLVEDNSDARVMLQAALENAGHLVRVAPDGVSALKLAASFTPDVAILDIGLPGINGYEVARMLRARFASLRLIALTGYGQDSDAEAARQAGFDAHCTKPITVGQLLDEIAACDTGGVRL